MKEELSALWEKGVYEWVEQPVHKSALSAKWVFKAKRDEKGAIEKYKQLDVKTAFLNGDLTEEIYLQPPDGFEDSEGKVWRLHKALYGLKQAAQAWHEKLKTSFATIGL